MRIDGSEWSPGPWSDEPDSKEFSHLACVARFMESPAVEISVEAWS